MTDNPDSVPEISENEQNRRTNLDDLNRSKNLFRQSESFSASSPSSSPTTNYNSLPKDFRIDISSGNHGLDSLMTEIQRGGNIQDLMLIIQKVENEIKGGRNSAYKFLLPEPFMLTEIIREHFYGENDPELVTPKSFRKLYRQLDWREMDINFCIILYWSTLIFFSMSVFCFIGIFVKFISWLILLIFPAFGVVCLALYFFLRISNPSKSINKRFLFFFIGSASIICVGALLSILLTNYILSSISTDLVIVAASKALTMGILIGIGFLLKWWYSKSSDKFVKEITFVPTYNKICNLLQVRLDRQFEYVQNTYDIPQQIRERQQQAAKNKIFVNIDADERRYTEELELENAQYFQQMRAKIDADERKYIETLELENAQYLQQIHADRAKIDADERKYTEKLELENAQYLQPIRADRAKIDADERKYTEKLELENARYLQQIRAVLAIAQANTDEKIKEIKKNLRLQELESEAALKYKSQDLEFLDRFEARKRGHELMIVRVKAISEILKEQARVLADDSQEKRSIEYQLQLIQGIQGDLRTGDCFSSNSLYDSLDKLTEIMTAPVSLDPPNPPPANPIGSNSSSPINPSGNPASTNAPSSATNPPSTNRSSTRGNVTPDLSRQSAQNIANQAQRMAEMRNNATSTRQASNSSEAGT